MDLPVQGILGLVAFLFLVRPVQTSTAFPRLLVYEWAAAAFPGDTGAVLFPG
jgi:hypothetical protein